MTLGYQSVFVLYTRYILCTLFKVFCGFMGSAVYFLYYMLLHVLMIEVFPTE